MRITLCVLLFACAPSPIGKRADNFLVVGHRGSPNAAAENTPESVHAAASEGANAIEIDVCMTADRVLVAWHDRDPDDAVALVRQTGGEGLRYHPSVPALGSPLRKPLDQLNYTDFAASHTYVDGDGNVAQVALWDDIRKAVRDHPSIQAVYVDVKVIDPVQAAAVVASVQDTDRRFIFLAVKEEMVQALRDASAKEVAWDFEHDGALEDANRIGIRHVSTGFTKTRLGNQYLQEIDTLVRAREAGQLDFVTAWTIDDEDDMQRLLDYGVNAIMTNDIARLLKTL